MQLRGIIDRVALVGAALLVALGAGAVLVGCADAAPDVEAFAIEGEDAPHLTGACRPGFTLVEETCLPLCERTAARLCFDELGQRHLRPRDGEQLVLAPAALLDEERGEICRMSVDQFLADDAALRRVTDAVTGGELLALSAAAAQPAAFIAAVRLCLARPEAAQVVFATSADSPRRGYEDLTPVACVLGAEALSPCSADLVP